MPTKVDKIKGLTIMFLSAAIFLFFFSYFNLSGLKLGNDITLVLKAFFTVSILISGLWLGLSFISGKKIATQIGGGLLIFTMIAFVTGFLRSYIS